MSVRGSSGCRRWSSIASAPPNDSPATCGRPSPSSSMNSASRSAKPAMPNDSGGSSEPPAPGASQAITVKASDSASSCGRQVAFPVPT